MYAGRGALQLALLMHSALFMMPCWVCVEEHSTVQVAVLAVQDKR